ncbi:hypothetical protein T03_15681 [Trichinella britovi]|uniref:Uncharacterized protein n=1 Tax=Trichinella britovi TaxID=45882 RepID=A0A0V1A2C6_TRIBR|nr:hypothetical protein T03_15681 [Trichinella britovi]
MTCDDSQEGSLPDVPFSEPVMEDQLAKEGL